MHIRLRVNRRRRRAPIIEGDEVGHAFVRWTAVGLTSKSVVRPDLQMRKELVLGHVGRSKAADKGRALVA